jgi:hypothetical protein
MTNAQALLAATYGGLIAVERRRTKRIRGECLPK